MSQHNITGWELDMAIEIAKAHAGSGNVRPVEDVIRAVYTVLKEINEE